VERFLEPQPDVVIAGGIAEEGRLRVVAEEVELENETEKEKGRDRRGPSPAGFRTGGYLPAARTSVVQL
jgi:hypothetical protein